MRNHPDALRPTRRRAARGALFPGTLLAMIALTASPAAGADECRLRYSVFGASGYQEETLNAGQNRNLTVNNLVEVLNVGTNDMLVRTGGVGGSTAETVVIRNGNGTIVLAPIAWTGRQLQRIECRNTATVTDASAYLNQLGSSASAIVANATSTALASAQEAQAAAQSLFDPSQAGQWQSQAEATLTDLQQAWADAQAQAAAAAQSVSVQVAEHFPELHTALTESQGFALTLPESAVGQASANLANTRALLAQMDAKYHVSETLTELASLDLAQEFPEIDALLSEQCTIDLSPVTVFEGQLQELVAELRALDEKYAVSTTLAGLLRLDVRRVDAVERAWAGNRCGDRAAAVSRSIERDLDALLAYLRQVEVSMGRLEADMFGPEQEAFFAEARALLQSTTELILALEDQRRLEQQAQDAEEAFQATYQKLDADWRWWLDFDFSGTAGLIDSALRRADVEGMRRDLEAHQSATEAYQRAIEERERGFLQLLGTFSDWAAQAGDLAQTATRLRITVSEVDPLLRLLAEPPRMETAGRTVEAATSCVGDYWRLWEAANQALYGTIGAYLGDVAAAGIAAVPEDVVAQLRKTIAAAEALGGTLAASAASMQGLIQAHAELVERKAALAVALAGNPRSSSYQSAASRRLDDLGQAVAGVGAAAGVLEGELGGTGAAAETLSRELAAFERLLEDHRNELAGDLTGLLPTLQEVGRLSGAMLASLESAGGCANANQALIAPAASGFPVRLAAFVDSRLTTAGQLMPAGLRAALDDVNEKANALSQAFVTLASATAKASQSASAFSAAAFDTGFPDVVLTPTPAGPVPVPYPDLAQYVPTALSALVALQNDLYALIQEGTAFASAQNDFHESLLALAEAMNAAGGELASDAVSLGYALLDIAGPTADFNRTLTLLPLWETALATFPFRLAAVPGLAAVAALSAVASQVEAYLAEIDAALGQLGACYQAATERYTWLGQANPVNAAASVVTTGLLEETEAVLAQLGALVPPTALTLLNTVSQAFADAEALMQRLSEIEQAAKSAFSESTATLQSELTTAASCVTNRRNLIIARATQIEQLL